MSKKSTASASKSSSKSSQKITTSSTAEYFSKNLQQVGFSSLTKAVLTTLKEAVDNALDACEEHEVLPEITVTIEKLGAGSAKNSDQIRVKVEDNGPGIDADDVPKVFGEYLASSKFGRGRCTRGQQGIGISAATTWAQLTSGKGARVITKTPAMRKALSCTVEVDIKNNKGVQKDRETIDWDRPQGTSVEFVFDGRLQINGEAGLQNYLMGTALVNPHLKLNYKLPDSEPQVIDRVSDVVPEVPDAVEPHPHTMKLGEFMAHSHLFGRMKASAWLRKGFSRVGDSALEEIVKVHGLRKAVLEKFVDSLEDQEFKDLFQAIQKAQLKAPSTQSVLSIGEETLSKSIKRLGPVDFFSVMTRKPTICDFKPVEVEVAIARLEDKALEPDSSVQVLRFANRVPLQFDKSACAIVQAITSVNWKSYGLAQPKDGLPIGPYIIAVSVVSPFIKFKNASKETIDASDELVEEIRRTLMQAGQRLCRHIRAEDKANELEQKTRHIEQFGPILVQGLCRISQASDARRKKAEDGLLKILGRDARETEQELKTANENLSSMEEKREARLNPKEAAVDEVLVAEVVEKAEKAEKPEKKTDKKKKNKRSKSTAEVVA